MERVNDFQKVRDPAVGAGGERKGLSVHYFWGLNGGSKVPALLDGAGANETTSVNVQRIREFL